MASILLMVCLRIGDLLKKERLLTIVCCQQLKIKEDSFLKGLFQQTLPTFLRNLDNTRRNVVMMDADLWSATLYALTTIAPYLKKGDIIFFDEFVVPTHEFKAYLDFVESHYVNLKLIAAANNYYFAAFKVE
jgi:hypothetical protein